MEIAPKVRFMKKKQKHEQSTEPDTEPPEEQLNPMTQAENEDEDDDDGWFTVKQKSAPLDDIDVDLSAAAVDKEKKLSKAKVAKKLRKKNLLVNKRVKYDDEGNVSGFHLLPPPPPPDCRHLSLQVIVDSEDEEGSSTYNIEEAKARLQQVDRTDKEAYRALVKEKHRVCLHEQLEVFGNIVFLCRNVG